MKIKAELLTEVEISSINRLLVDDRYVFEEKHNGERRIICKDVNGIHDYNREGDEGKGFPAHIVNMLAALPQAQFVIDVEWESYRSTVVILDVLMIGDDSLVHDPYKQRKIRAHKEFDSRHPMLMVSPAAVGQEEKAALAMKLANEGAEGIAVKKNDAPYRQGRAGQHFKIKFWKSLDAVVMGPSRHEHNSVEVGLFREDGKLHRICGLSLNGKPLARIGDVVEMDYLYGTDKLEAVQVNLVRIRDDKRPHLCTIDQLKINKNFRRAKAKNA